MPAGDLLDVPGDIEYRGLLFATAPNPAGLWLDEGSVVSGLGRGETETDVQDLPIGAAFGPQRPLYREVTITQLSVDTAAAMDALNAAMGRSAVPTELLWLGHGHPDDEPRFVYATPVAAPRDSDAEQAAAEYCAVDLRFWCADPRIYSLDEHETEVSPSNPTVPNAGAEPAPWRLVVEGPCTHPRVRNMVTSQAWRFDNLTLTSGQTLTVDTRAMTAVVSESGEDDIDVWPQAEDDDGRLAMLWGIAPGGMAVGFNSDGGSTTATLYSRDTWL